LLTLQIRRIRRHIFLDGIPLPKPNVAIERPSKWAKPACEGPSRMAC